MTAPATPRPVIIDTDPGQDDAIAILLALGSPELDVLGIVAVAGNVPLSWTSRNALLLCELAGRTDVPVFAGCDRPMVRALVTAEEVHGRTGLDGPDWSEPTTALQEAHGVDWMIDTVRAAGDDGVTICALGPLTDLAMALVRAPDIAANIREIVTMGGGYFVGGNVTPAAEFNIYVDPHAAHVVYTSGVPIVSMSLDVTHKALMPPEWIASLRDTGPIGVAANEMLTFYEQFDLERYRDAGGPVHDPATVAWLLDPSLYGGKDVLVEIETASELTMGMTVVDWWGSRRREPNAHWVTEVDADRFFALISERIAVLDAAT